MKRSTCKLIRVFTAYCLLPTAYMLTPTADLLSPSAYAQEIGFDRVVIDKDLPGGYQVEVADVNGDKKLDIVALGGSTCAWYENPTWKKRIVSSGKQTPGI